VRKSKEIYFNFLIRLFIVFFLSALGGFSLNYATIRYVSHFGSNTYPYTSWATSADSIMTAISVSSSGDTIYVANGVYKERVDMTPGLTLIGAGMDSCILDSREFTYVNEFYTIEVFDSCFLSGFGIFTYDIDHGNGVIIESGTNAKIENCRIQEAYNGIIIFSGSENKPFVYKNIILAVTDGITSFFASSVIKENIIYPREDGLVSQIISSPTYIDNTIVFDNIIGSSGFENYGGSSKLNNNLFYGRGSYGFWTYGDSIKNNVVFGEGGNWGVGFFGAGSVIKNSHVENAETGLYYDIGGGTPPTYRYNNMWDNQTNFQNFLPDTTNLFVNPMFVNPNSMDFHLQKYSLLINAGDPDIFDKDSSRSDIGLYGGPFGESYVYLDLSPRPPVNFSAEVDSNIITLRWNKNTETDFNHYNLYRDTVANFTIDSTKLVASVTDTSYLYFIPANVESLYFKLTAVDNQGNESNPSEEVEIIITAINDYPMTINDYKLYQNYPNPFNPSTKIGYRLKERSYVKLYVYSITGELVSVLVNQTQEAGHYEVEFNAGIGSGQSAVGNSHSGLSGISGLASGVYIYQIMVSNERDPSKPGPSGIPVFSDIKKMIYIK